MKKTQIKTELDAFLKDDQEYNVKTSKKSFTIKEVTEMQDKPHKPTIDYMYKIFVTKEEFKIGLDGVKIYMHENFVTKDEFKNGMKEVNARIDKIFDILKTIVDKIK